MPDVSLRARFLIFGLACLIPFAVVVGYYIDRSRDQTIERTVSWQTTLASQTSRTLGTFLETNTDALTVLAQQEAVVGMDPAQADNALGQLRRDRQEFSGIVLFDRDLQPIGNGSGVEAEELLENIAPQIETTLSQGSVTVSPSFRLESDLDVIVLMVPVTTVAAIETDAGQAVEPIGDMLPETTTTESDESADQPPRPPGETIGVIGGVVPVDRLAQWSLPVSRGDAEIAVATAQRIVFATSGVAPDESSPRSTQQEAIELALEGEINTFTYADAGGDRVGVAAPIGFEPAPWTVIVSQPAPSYLLGLVLPEMLIVFSLAVIVIVAMAVVLGESTAQPLRTLAAQALALQRGQLTEPIRPGGTGEVRSLGRRFAEMADQINMQVAALEDNGHEREVQAAQMRDLLRRTNRLQEDERRRIAGEIHDAVSPLITGALYQTRALQMTNGHTPREDHEATLSSVNELLERAGDELHGVIFDLRPPDLDDLGVVAAIEAYVQTIQRTGLSCRLETSGEPPDLTPEVRLSIYRIVQEALHNVVRHAGADEAVVRLETTDQMLRVSIRDNGAGFDPVLSVRPQSLGLLSMRERAESIGATFAIVSKAGGGTAIVMERANSGDVMSDAVLERMIAQSSDAAAVETNGTRGGSPASADVI